MMNLSSNVMYQVNDSISIELVDVNQEDIVGVYRFVKKNTLGGILSPDDFLRYSEEERVIRNPRNRKLFEKPKPGFHAASFFISDSIEQLEYLRQQMNKSFGDKSIAQGDLIVKGYNKMDETEYTVKVDGVKTPVPTTFHLNHWKYVTVKYSDYVSCFAVVRA